MAGKTCFALALLLIMLIFISSSSPFFINGEDINYPSVAYPPSAWNNVPVFDFGFWESIAVSPILVNGSFVCGFHCKINQIDHCFFAVSILQSSSPNIVWSANRNYPLKLRATLQLNEEGGLILQDRDGIPVWNTTTKGKFVSGLMLTANGNLVLFNINNEMIWQSFDHPTDTLLPGQALVSGQKLTANLSPSNSNAGLYSLALINDSLIAFLEPDIQQVYFGPWRVKKTHPPKVQYLNGCFDSFVLPSTSAAQFIQLGSDGQLRAFQFIGLGWKPMSDILINYTGACDIPLVCGEYGVCSDGVCNCPKTEGNDAVTYFKQVSEDNPNLGCSEIRPVSCNPSDYHSLSLLELKDFDTFHVGSHAENADRTKCKEACLQNCSCKAAIHRQKINSSDGFCFLLSKILSFKRNVENLHNYDSFVYIKVQNPPITQITSRVHNRRQLAAILGSTLGVILAFLFAVVSLFSIWRNRNVRRKENDSKHDGEDAPKHRKLRLTRFSYDYLAAMTENFSVKLGEGGFGSVFYGSLLGGIKIAVKRLDGSVHVKKSFLGEVETLRTVHHTNLVTLIGFCADKPHLLLVYEYMQNGSLDKWIFNRNTESALSWKQREKIIHDVAEGLSYLHDGCDQRILHLDIKPQNILLDENFKAQLADFGLSKLIGRDQNQVLTTMRGTPGYMAPEWSSATITEKVDVYSFGIVVMEIMCGRRNVDRSQPEEDIHLLRIFKKKADEGRLVDLVDQLSEDMVSNEVEAVKMMRVAAWCLQAHHTRRPTMRQVLHVLKGNLEVKIDLDFDFLNPQTLGAAETQRNKARITTVALPSILSCPR